MTNTKQIIMQETTFDAMCSLLGIFPEAALVELGLSSMVLATVRAKKADTTSFSKGIALLMFSITNGSLSPVEKIMVARLMASAIIHNHYGAIMTAQSFDDADILDPAKSGNYKTMVEQVVLAVDSQKYVGDQRLRHAYKLIEKVDDMVSDAEDAVQQSVTAVETAAKEAGTGPAPTPEKITSAVDSLSTPK